MPLNNLPIEFWGLLLGVVGAILAWLLTDASFKTRMLNLEEKVAANKLSSDVTCNDLQTKIGYITIQNTRSEQDRNELHHLVDRLESSKASKEVVEGVKQEITILRMEMDKRFDRLDKMLDRILDFKGSAIKLEDLH